MSHAYLIELTREGHWVPYYLLIVSYKELRGVVDQFGRNSGLRWRRLHHQDDVDHYRTVCELLVTQRHIHGHAIDWS